MNIADDIVIVTGGIVNPDIVTRFCCEEYPDAYIIGVDKGLEILDDLGIKPDLIIGDFDSVNDSIRARYMCSPDAIVLNPKKDYTDTHVAVMEAIKNNPENIVIIGATGSRIDHMMANIAVLKLCLMRGIRAAIVDKNNRISMIDKHFHITKQTQYGRYISCIPFSDEVHGITIRGFEYDLDNASMIKEESIGISNELREEEGFIDISSGYMLIMETKD